jgi:hypothetical protein
MNVHEFAFASERALTRCERISVTQPANAAAAYAVTTTALQRRLELWPSKRLRDTKIKMKGPDCIHGDHEIAERPLSCATARV